MRAPLQQEPGSLTSRKSASGWASGLLSDVLQINVAIASPRPDCRALTRARVASDARAAALRRDSSSGEQGALRPPAAGARAPSSTRLPAASSSASARSAARARRARRATGEGVPSALRMKTLHPETLARAREDVV